VRRQLLYVGEINDSQRAAAWCQTILRRSTKRGGKQIAMFAEDGAAPPLGGCWLACHLWDQLEADDFWSPRLLARQGTRWLNGTE
jgi:hypothetical protein